MDRRTLFWNLLLVASGIAACVSLLTTGVGLARYLPLMLAWPLALAVQLGLFGLAWLIAIGRAKLRPLVVGLYCLTMPFSVVFSYVMLQSEFTDEIRPEEAQRALFDDLRQRSSQIAAEIDASLAESKELELRLASWVEMERSEGWTTATCDENENCYLAGVCERVQLKIDNWEQRTGQSYRQGPGEALIFGSLETETKTVNQIAESLRIGRQEWVSNESLFEAGLDNRERLRRYDLALANLPQRDMQEVRCEALALPPSPPYESFARDNALSQEKPIYAFEDLAAIFSLSHQSDRSDYPTLFAFFLALFIDLFVLFVAIGGAVVGVMDTPGGDYPVIQPVPPEWGDALQRDITSWIDGALLQARKSAEDRKVFLSEVLNALRFERGSRALLVPKDARENRFGFLMASAKAAKPAPLATGEGESESMGFVLEDWVYPALARYLSTDEG